MGMKLRSGWIMKVVRRLLSSFLLAGAMLLGATPDLGPAIGARIPKFSLADQSGKQQTFDSIKGPKGAVLVFFRSADW